LPGPSSWSDAILFTPDRQSLFKSHGQRPWFTLEISSALDEYTPETTRPLFDVDGVPLKDTEQIWNEIKN